MNSKNNKRQADRGASAKRQDERRLSVRAIRRNPTDLRKLAQALLSIARAEAAARADHDSGRTGDPSDADGRRDQEAA